MFDSRLKPIHERYEEDAADRNSSGANVRTVEESVRTGEDESGTTRSPRARPEESLDDVEMFAFLEKYSDRLVEMVSKKVMDQTKEKERG